MGEQVKAMLPGMEGTDNLAEELIAFVKSRIAGYKAPLQHRFCACSSAFTDGQAHEAGVAQSVLVGEGSLTSIAWMEETLYSAASPMPCHICC